jgi:hypothetical protein
MLQWNKINPGVSLVGTKKKFFGECLYKIVIWAPGARILQDHMINESTIQDRIDQRIEIYKQVTTYSSWRSNRSDSITYANAEQLKYLYQTKNQYKDQIRFRVEEPYVTIYSDDETLLYSIAQNSCCVERLEEVHGPANTTAELALNRGEIVVKTPTEYSYKIILRSIWNIAVSDKQSISDYLYNLGDEVKLTKSVARQLGNSNTWFPGGYIYAKDQKITTFLNLINPNLISGIYKLTVL